MNPSQENNVVNKANKIIFGVFLLLVIVGSGIYGLMKFKEVNYMLTNVQDVDPVASKINSDEKEALLASVAPKDMNTIEENEKLEILKRMSLKQDIDVKIRVIKLDSLK